MDQYFGHRVIVSQTDHPHHQERYGEEHIANKSQTEGNQ